MWRPLFSLFGPRKSRRAARRRAQPHRFSGSRLARYGAEQLEARWYLSGDPIVQVNTNFGNFQIELLPSAAPQTVANFLSYVNSGAYTNTFFHRSVQQGIGIVQAGGFTSASPTFTSTSQFQTIPTNAPIPLEYNLPNAVGTIAMARTNDPNSATDQFFINDLDNSSTLGQSNGGGYAVFGKIIGNGMTVVNQIAALPTTAADGGLYSTLPLGPNNQLVQITSMTMLDGVYGTVFADANGNGTVDSGEGGVAGRTVFVDVDGTGQPNNTNPSATTDANGNYYIGAVPAGSFSIKEVLPGGVHATTTLQTVTFTTSSAATNVNFGEGPAIVGTVFADLKADGSFDSGDPGIGGRTVFLNIDGTGQLNNNPSTTTAANGNFSFAGLNPGTYNVMEVAPSGVTVSTNTQSIVVQQNQPAAVANIGETSAIAGLVFNDLNSNGKLESGEPGLSGITVFLNNDGSGKPDGNNPSTTTDAQGRFYFSGLATGQYTVMQVISAYHGVTQTTTAVPVAITAGSPSVTVNIGDVLTSTLVPLPVGVNTQTPPSNGNAAFIDDLYFTLLGRHANQQELAGWQQRMSGGTTRTAVAQAIWSSPEHRGLEVDQFYQTFLNRAAEPDGRTFWINRFTSGDLTERLAARFFISSPEYQADHKTDTDFITAVYQDVLSRAPSASDLTSWQASISGGMTRDQAATAIVNGGESAARIIDSYFVNFLHRAPDAGAQDLANTLVAGKTTAAGAGIGILATDEYFALADSGK